jgi:hypothetical protein
MWLAGQIHQRPENVSQVIYGALIDVDSNRATGRDGVDYQLKCNGTIKLKHGLGFSQNIQRKESQGFWMKISTIETLL